MIRLPAVLRSNARLWMAALVLLTTLLGIGVSPAHAAACTTSGNIVTCTYSFTGVAETFTVPEGVASVRIVARGASGAPGVQNSAGDALGGRGAEVRADLAVSPNQSLVLVVGGAPTVGGCFSVVRCIGGFNGGGTSDFGGGGGGASDVRVGGNGLAQRVLVAAGGGGGGESFNCGGALVAGGQGGDAGSAGTAGAGCKGISGGGGGQPGSQTAGGAGGDPGDGNGTLGTGGDGGGGGVGGGGGGGYYGGGGGGDLRLTPDFQSLTAAGGGGGGSNLVPTGGTASLTAEPAAIVVSYTLPTPTDSTPPAITPTVDGTLGDADWYVSDVAVSWSVVDAESAVTGQSGCEAQSITNDTAGVTLTCSATSTGGTNSRSVTIKRDATAPGITIAAPTAATYVLNQAVAADYSCSDGGSGVASCTGTVADGAGIDTGSLGAKTFTVNAVDAAGNEAVASVAYGVRDATAPVVTPVVSGTVGDNGWYTSDVAVSFTVVDDESSVTTSGCDPVTVTTDGTRSFTCTATSDGGEASATVEVKRDATAPVLAPVVTPQPVLQGYPASVAPNASDATSGVADASCGTISTAAVGSFQVGCTATDAAGNQATVTVAYQVEPALVCDSLIGTRAQLEALGYNVIVGDGASNVLVGTNGPDLILGLGGSDLILAGGGDDVVCGGAGNDIVFLGNGDDRALGDGGVDVIDGGGGNDTIDGGLDDDAITGGEGNDVLVGGAGRDLLVGGRGNDAIDGGAGTDRCDGGAGTDAGQRCESTIGIP